ncbi:carbohydrate kinase [Flavobacterium sp. 14A]|uniref:carbohydrate kinase family protein n=1 Tax=Flavobacterium sp. 14A TaxID=2735896 RepID=UPI0015708E7B|nr:carbohydrate kinase [Flavobacterium sp. 14A]NRT10673.1 fructokinase [Flavobacterium sp. 14A]
MIKATCFGEILWDVFPTHKKIGGAPLNVAIRLASMGNEVGIISRVGKGKKGKQLIQFLNENAVATLAVQIDEQYKTGKVKVTLDEKGSAYYDIMQPRAWDNIQLTDAAITLVKEADIFIYGSLASRNEVTANTLNELLKFANYKIFDVNLRQPHYTAAVLENLLVQADFIKFNDDEIYEVATLLGSTDQSFDHNILFIAEKTKAKCICVTRGSQGAVLYIDSTFYYNSGYHVEVVDTVGAGDSFLATITSKLMNNDDPQEAIDHACAIGALVASREGANPVITAEDITNLIGTSTL